MQALIKAEQLAEMLGLSPDQVRRLTRDGVMPHHRIGGAIRYDFEAVKNQTVKDQEIITLPAPNWLRGMYISDDGGKGVELEAVSVILKRPKKLDWACYDLSAVLVNGVETPHLINRGDVVFGPFSGPAGKVIDEWCTQ